jgi:preprotein translocase subunit SecE
MYSKDLGVQTFTEIKEELKMAILRPEDSKKWIQGLLVLSSVLLAYIISAFLFQLGDWFDLESKIPKFNGFVQIVSIALGIASLTFLIKNAEVQKYLSEVYEELTKVIWPDGESTLKLTVGIVFGIIITSIVLGVVDFGVGKIFRLFYS